METNSYPASSLRYALAKRTVVELRSLARSYYVKGRSRMRKSALIEAVFYELLDMDRLIELAYVTDPYTWDLFQRAAVERVVMVDSAAPPRYRLLVELGYLSCGETEAGVCLSMPDELKAVFIDLAMGGLPKQKQRFDLIHAYAQAATNLYGVIGLENFAALFNQQNEEPASIDELLSVLITGMVIHMFNTTRTSRDNGHTPEELRRLGAPPQPHQEKWNQTPGRNTPCSCGSGKKYKKCCGR